MDASDIFGEQVTQDLRYADLTKQTLFGKDFRGANLYGASISLTCETFDGVDFSDLQVAQLLLMVTSANIHDDWKIGLRQLVEDRIGQSRYRALSRLMSLV